MLDSTEPAGEIPASECHGDQSRRRVRVPVVFDHFNQALGAAVRRRQAPLARLVGHDASVMCGEGLRFGKFEVWVNCDAATAASPRACAETAVHAVEEALARLGLDPTGDVTGLSVVDNQVVVGDVVDGRNS